MNITRHHLLGLGATRYQSVIITKSCPVQGKQASANLYRISDVIQSTTNYLRRPRIHQTTKNNFMRLLPELQYLVNNVVDIPFTAPNTESKSLVKQLLKSFDNPKTREHKLRALAIKGKEATRDC